MVESLFSILAFMATGVIYTWLLDRRYRLPMRIREIDLLDQIKTQLASLNRRVEPLDALNLIREEIKIANTILEKIWTEQ